MRNLFLTSTAVVGLTISSITAQAHLGWTLAECKQHYGKLTKAPEAADAGRTFYTFVNKGFRIEVYFPTDDHSASRVVYVRNFPVDLKQIHILMDANAPNVTWSDPIKDSDGTADHHFVGTKNDQITNYAQVDSLCEIFAIWTVADDTAIILSKEKDTKDPEAGLGWTLSECEQRYGQPTARAEHEPGDKLFYKFANNEYEIGVDIHKGTGLWAHRSREWSVPRRVFAFVPGHHTLSPPVRTHNGDFSRFPASGDIGGR